MVLKKIKNKIKNFCRDFKNFCLFKATFLISIVALTYLVLKISSGKTAAFFLGMIYFLLFILNFLLTPIVLEEDLRKIKKKK